ncbi:hypothetical protein DB459_21900 [Bradyrhizobium sp. WD16]|nr:hypothetical protein DB459_21900 [Bradyrhizobium sp. WD16]
MQHGSSWTGSGGEAIAMMAWLCACQLAEALHARIDEIRVDELRRGLVVMHPNDRKEKLADIDNRIRAGAGGGVLHHPRRRQRHHHSSPRQG